MLTYKNKDSMDKREQIIDLLNKCIIGESVANTADKILALFSVSKRFLVTYRYTNRTDAALHEDEVEARNCVEACNKVCANHNYEVEWHTVKDVS